MAIRWEKEIDGTQYQVRSAGSSIRLYTDGVFHSQYNKRTKVSGGIWDLLMIPAYFHEPMTLKRILVLGVGGGAVLRMFLDHFAPELILGVELNPTHISIAQRFFGLKNSKVKLIEQDAVLWMKAYRGPKFDLIIEDLFGENQGEPVRAVEPDLQWAHLLSKNLSSKGLMISNFLTRREICLSGFATQYFSQEIYQSAWIFENHRYDNQIAVFSRTGTSLPELNDRLSRASALNPALRKSSKNFSAIKLSCRNLRSGISKLYEQ